ncbi:MAG: hypothetical protein JW838_15170 [Spirochaetes bacterium]|nr:hypothetical protein [Spirochaetota bacterium]
MVKPALSIILATAWISASEFIRNELLFKSYWIEHYRAMGITFPSEPVNGAIWGLWSLLFAILIYLIAGKFNLIHTFCISWLGGFVLMWLVIGNLGVLPFGLLYFAVPLSLLEAFIASFIVKKLR